MDTCLASFQFAEQSMNDLHKQIRDLQPHLVKLEKDSEEVIWRFQVWEAKVSYVGKMVEEKKH
jgi:hypothetical protein